MKKEYSNIKKEIGAKLIPLLKAKQLSALCSDSGACMMFGKYTELLKSYFEDMNFKYLILPITRIGKPSVNGFINQFIFERNKYKLYCVLKSSRMREADNLLYEYWVGKQYINYLIPRFPCFLETFNIYEYKLNLHELMLNGNGAIVKKFDYDTYLHKINVDNKKSIQSYKNMEEVINLSCTDPTKLCILIQHMDSPLSFESFVIKLLIETNKSTIIMLFIELIHILLQIYLPLGKLMNEFSHNDLHMNNVLLYKVPDNNYIQLTYVLEDGTKYSFNTCFIAKIIDYGRCFFKMDSENSSKIFFKKIQNNKVCIDKNIHRGMQTQYGYGWFDEFLDYDNYYISSLIGNISKDLWLIQILNNNFLSNVKTDDVFINKIIDCLKKLNNENVLLPPIKTDKCPKSKYCNVKMFADILCNFVKESDNMNIIQNIEMIVFKDKKMLSNMEIYLNENKNIKFNAIYDRKLIPKPILKTIPKSIPKALNDNKKNIEINPLNLKLIHEFMVVKPKPKQKSKQKAKISIKNLPRCPKGTKQNKKTGNCDAVDKKSTQKNLNMAEIPKQTSIKAKISIKKMPRCPNGTRRNKKTGNCE